MSCRAKELRRPAAEARRTAAPPRASGPGGSRGRAAPAFTLIELLIAIVLLGVVIALTYGAMFQVTGGAQQLTQEFSDDQELRLVIRMVAQDLGAVQYLKAFAAPVAGGAGRPSGLIARTEFVASGDFAHLSFHAAVPSRQNRQRPEEGDPLLHEVGYQVQEERTTHTLVLARREDYYLDEDLEAGGVTAVLARNVEVFKVECLLPSAAPGQSQEVWVGDWNSPQAPESAKLPRALRVTLGLSGKNGRHLKETVEINLQSVLGIGP